MKMNYPPRYSSEKPQPQQQPDLMRSKQQVNVKLTSNHQQHNLNTQQVQRKLFSFIYLYAILIVALYVTYAAYYFYQHHAHYQQQLKKHPNEEGGAEMKAAAQQAAEQQPESQLEERLESKIHLLERYIELIALDLQETKSKLREREKCACSIGCSFNGTNYADGSSWQNQCDICTCQLGKISCVPQKCPALKCDVAITLPGQCCPSCMKRCKHNNAWFKHGQKLNVGESNSKTKECKCHDGLIKCEQIQKRQPTLVVRSQTIEGDQKEAKGSQRNQISSQFRAALLANATRSLANEKTFR